MDFGHFGLTETVPSALSGSATGIGYTHDTVVLLMLTQYIRNLGYRAVASIRHSPSRLPSRPGWARLVATAC